MTVDHHMSTRETTFERDLLDIIEKCNDRLANFKAHLSQRESQKFHGVEFVDNPETRHIQIPIDQEIARYRRLVNHYEILRKDLFERSDNTRWEESQIRMKNMEETTRTPFVKVECGVRRGRMDTVGSGSNRSSNTAMHFTRGGVQEVESNLHRMPAGINRGRTDLIKARYAPIPKLSHNFFKRLKQKADIHPSSFWHGYSCFCAQKKFSDNPNKVILHEDSDYALWQRGWMQGKIDKRQHSTWAEAIKSKQAVGRALRLPPSTVIKPFDPIKEAFRLGREYQLQSNPS